MKKNKIPKINLQMFGGMSPDQIEQRKIDVMQKMNEALKEGNEERFTQAFTEFTEYLQEAVLEEANAIAVKTEAAIQAVDSNVLVGRGARQLTTKETEYYQKVIESMKSKDPKQALTNLDVVMPETIIDSVFEDLVKDHPLLAAIDFRNTSAITKMLLNTHGDQLATWDKLCTAIVEEITSGFRMVDMSLNKLSAFIPICKDMLELGPKWIDRYVRAILGEAIAFGLEEAIINGTGKDQPIGMNRQVGDDVTVTGGVYPVKNTVKVADLSPKSYGALLAPMAKFVKNIEEVEDGDDIITYGTRKITNVIMIVNPTDYLLKIMPATTIRGTDGLYRNNVLPFPTEIIQSIAVPEGKAIIGLAKRYFMGIGTTKSGKIEFSDEYRFLEDERVYLTKLYGHGQALDNNAFVYADISELEPANVTVKVVEETPEA